MKHKQSFFSKTAMLALIFFLSMTGCIGPPQDFDETVWRKKVESARTSDLYASNFQGGRFFNPWMPMEEKGFLRFLRWKLSNREDFTEEEKQFLPAFIPNAANRIKATQDDLIMWVGHTTFLVRLNGEYWLTDPIFSNRALLPKRKTPPAINAEDLLELNIKRLNIIISHNHYDHLDKKTIRSLPDNTRFFVPLGLKTFLKGLGKNDIVEMNWWQTVDAGNGTNIACLPMQHWSRRIGYPLNSSLWASFMIVTPDVIIYFAGDGGYFIGYREIGRLYPRIDYVLMPTTAYHPRWFMHYAHMDIDETIDAFHDLKAQYFIPTQWGTFHLGDEPVGFPAIELKRKISEKGLDPSRFLIMDIGQIVSLKVQNRQATKESSP